MKQPERCGFTLIEILVVMAIIGVLASVVGGSFIISRVRARDSDRKNSLVQMQKSLELYLNDYGVYPDGSTGEISGVAWGEAFSQDGTTFMQQIPSDAQEPTRQYLYETDADLRKYRLFTNLENTRDSVTDIDKDGTPGDVYVGKTCGTKSCNHGVSSPNTTMTEIW